MIFAVVLFIVTMANLPLWGSRRFPPRPGSAGGGVTAKAVVVIALAVLVAEAVR